MKKICSALVFPLLFLMLLSACGDTVSPVPTESVTQSAETEAPSEEPAATARPADAAPMLVIDGVAVPDAEINYVLAGIVEEYMSQGGIDWDGTIEGQPAAEYLLDCAREKIVTYHVTYNKATELGFGLTQEDIDYINESLLQFDIDAYGGQEAFDLMLESMGCSQDIYRFYLYDMPTVESNLITGLFVEGSDYASTEEDILALYESDFTNVAYIAIKKMDDNGLLFTGQQLESQRSIAQTLHQKVMDGEDFTGLLLEYGQDTIMEMSPEGITVSRGEMDDAFDTAVDQLAEGAISAVVESEYCFYIIKKCPTEPGWFDENRELVQARYEFLTSEALIQQWIAQTTVEISDEYMALDVQSYLPKG